MLDDYVLVNASITYRIGRLEVVGRSSTTSSTTIISNPTSSSTTLALAGLPADATSGSSATAAATASAPASGSDPMGAPAISRRSRCPTASSTRLRAHRSATGSSWARRSGSQHGSSETHFAPMPPDAVVFAAIDRGSGRDGQAVRRRGGADHRRSAPAPRSRATRSPVHGGVSARPVADDPDRRGQRRGFRLHRPGRRAPRAAQRASARPGPVLPDRSRRQCDDRRHGLDPRVGHQRGALRHDARGGAGADASSPPTAAIIRTSRRARKSAAGYDLTRLFVGSEGTLGIITEVTLRLHAIPEAISRGRLRLRDASQGAVDTVVQSIQLGIPLARVEILDDMQIRAVNRWSKLDLSRADHPVLRIPRLAERYVAEQVETVRELADGQWRRRVPLGEPARGAHRSCGRRGTRPIMPRSTCAPARSAGRPTSACRSAASPSASPRPSADLEAVEHSGDRSSAMSATAISTSSSRSIPNTPGRAGRGRGDQRAAGRARAGDGRHLHRRARHRPRQAGLAGRGTGRGGRPDARRSSARSTRKDLLNPGKIFAL